MKKDVLDAYYMVFGAMIWLVLAGMSIGFDVGVGYLGGGILMVVFALVSGLVIICFDRIIRYFISHRKEKDEEQN